MTSRLISMQAASASRFWIAPMNSVMRSAKSL